jgi:hypothetical protein
VEITDDDERRFLALTTAHLLGIHEQTSDKGQAPRQRN